MTRLLFVHAHPDDESLWTGVAIARHARAGDQVHVLTCTLGEEGNVIPDDLRHLQLPAGRQRPFDGPDPLAEVRRTELREATARLGVTSSVVLGEWEGRDRLYRDSGRVGAPSAAHPRAFSHASVELAASLVAGHIERVQADAVVTYDRHGGQGHPDHVQCHRVVREAVCLAAHRPALYVALTPVTWAREDRRWLAEHVRSAQVLVPTVDAAYPPSVVDDDLVTTVVDDPSVVDVQREALRCHRTQVSVHDGYFALPSRLAWRLSGREGYARVDAATGRPVPDRSGHLG